MAKWEFDCSSPSLPFLVSKFCMSARHEEVVVDCVSGSRQVKQDEGRGEQGSMESF